MLTRGYLAIVYVSSSKESILGPLLSLSRSLRDTRGTLFAHSFRDEHYNRTSFFLVDTDGANLANSAAQLYESATSSLNFQDHSGSHPTLGVCDHVTFCPLRSGDKEALGENKDDASGLISTSGIAKDFMKKISSKASVFSYGGASDNDIPLATIRRRLGYFNQVTDSADECVYDSEDLRARVRECVSHATRGDSSHSFSFYEDSLQELNSAVGVTCVGAIPYIMNFNVKFDEASDVRLVKKVTKAVRQLESVEALTLRQGSAHEVACNLKNPGMVGPDKVLRACEEQARELALTITGAYATGPTEARLLEILQGQGVV